MPRHCTTVPFPGGFAILCGGRRVAPCSVPGCGRPHEKLCDAPLWKGAPRRTCDAKLCATHAQHVGKNRDYCAAHAKQAALPGWSTPNEPATEQAPGEVATRQIAGMGSGSSSDGGER